MGGDELGKDISLEQYVAVLDEKYQKIIEILENEENQYRVALQKNEELKSELAQTMQDCAEYETQSRSQLAYLDDTRKQVIGTKQQKKIDFHYKKIEKKKLEDFIEDKQKEIEKLLTQTLQIKEEVAGREKQAEDLKKEIDAYGAQLEREVNQLGEINRQYEQSLSNFGEAKNEFMVLAKKNKELEGQVNRLFGNKLNYDIETKKINQDYKSTIKHLMGNQQKFEEVEQLKEKLVQEIVLRTNQLNEMRSNNEQLEKRIAKMSSVAKQSQIEHERFIRLSSENRMLEKQVKEMQTQAVMKGSQQLNQEINSDMNSSIMEIERVLNLEKFREFNSDYGLFIKEMVKQNQELEAMAEQQDETLQSRNKILECQYKAIEELKNSLQEQTIKLENLLLEKRSYQENFDMLSQERDHLQFNYNKLNASLHAS